MWAAQERVEKKRVRLGMKYSYAGLPRDCLLATLSLWLRSLGVCQGAVTRGIETLSRSQGRRTAGPSDRRSSGFTSSLCVASKWSGRRDLNPGPLAPQTPGRLLCVPWLWVFSMGYTDSGRLLPLVADGARLNFCTFLCTVSPLWLAAECIESSWIPSGCQEGPASMFPQVRCRHACSSTLLETVLL
jgi:hypothetical protein